MSRYLRFAFMFCLFVGFAGCGSGSSSPSPPPTPPPPQIGVVTTLAGMAGIPGHLDGTGTGASFNQPFGITSDGTNLYVADTFNDIIRSIVISTKVVTTPAGTATIATFTDGTGTLAFFNQPNGITTDGTNLYVADTTNNAIRQIVISGAVVTTLAGGPPPITQPGSSDGTGALARFNAPTGIVTDGTNLYVTDKGNNTIRQIVIASGAATTLAGTAGTTGFADGSSGAASFNSPDGIAISSDKTTLYVADQGNNTIRKIVIASAAVSTLAGTHGVTGTTDATGASASFNTPTGITVVGTNLFVTDKGNNTIRKIVTASGAVTTLAGTAGASGFTDGTGAAARFNAPAGITTDGTNLYVTDVNNDTIRMIQNLN